MKTPLSMFVLALLSLCPIPAAAQQPAEATSYPARSVKVVVPYPPGAAADIIGRLVAQKLSELTGSQFYVENLPGAGGVIGTAAAARAFSQLRRVSGLLVKEISMRVARLWRSPAGIGGLAGRWASSSSAPVSALASRFISAPR